MNKLIILLLICLFIAGLVVPNPETPFENLLQYIYLGFMLAGIAATILRKFKDFQEHPDWTAFFERYKNEWDYFVNADMDTQMRVIVRNLSLLEPHYEDKSRITYRKLEGNTIGDFMFGAEVVGKAGVAEHLNLWAKRNELDIKITKVEVTADPDLHGNMPEWYTLECLYDFTLKLLYIHEDTPIIRKHRVGVEFPRITTLLYEAY